MAMTTTDFVSALAQILVNPALRETFIANPHTAAEILNLSGDARSLFLALSPEQVSHQAQLLINKRMRETFLQLPVTIKGLGPTAAAHFAEYATHNWPTSSRRHSEDALRFCQFLGTRQLTYNHSEYNRCRFKCAGKRLQFFLATDAWVNGRLHFAVQICYRRKGQAAEWRFYFKA
jgi:hypothetical protein